MKTLQNDGMRRWAATATSLLLLAIGMLWGAQPALGQSSGNLCIEEEIGGNPSCTANDVRIATLTAVGGPPSCVEGDDVTVTLEALIESSPERYAVGIWLNEDGGSAQSDPSGTCFRDFLKPVSGDNSDCSSTLGPFYNGDGDACGDVDAQGSAPCGTGGSIITGPCTEGGGTCVFSTYQFEATFLCNDSDNDGTADVGSCTSWKQNADGTCTDELGTDPGTGSKCNCSVADIIGLQTGCVSDAECDNGEFCDGAETCDLNTGECVDGTPVTCNDAVGCTADSCDEVNDTCLNVPNDAFCNDGEFCNGVETCDPLNDCQAGTAPDCSDPVSCTIDSCDEVNDVCVNAPDDSICNDGEFCNGVETCDPQNDCQAGTAPDCSDPVSCTIDSCDEVNDVCVNAPDDSICNDGEFCNGVETCDAVNDCQPGTPVVCTGDDCNNGFCNETLDACDLVPTNEGGMCGDDTDNVCTDPDTCDDMGNCLPNNEPCAAVTDSALCLFDVATKGVCVDGQSLTGEVCDTTNGDADCTTGVCVEESQFRLLFTPYNQNWPSYKLNASNPGQFYYNLVSDKPGCVGGSDMETFEITIPYPFVTHGARPLHVYDGADVGNAVGDDCFMPPEEALAALDLQISIGDWLAGTSNPAFYNLDCEQVNTVGGMGFCTFEVEATYPDSCQLYINVHLDYGLKGKDVDANPPDNLADRYDRGGLESPWGSYDALQDDEVNIAIFDCKDHNFSHEEVGTATTFDDTVQNLNYFKRPAGAFGLVQTSSNGQGVSGASLSLVHPTNGVVQTGETDEDGYYLLNYKHKGKPTAYTITLDDGSELSGEAPLKGNGFVEVNFDLTEGTATTEGDEKPGNNGKSGK